MSKILISVFSSDKNIVFLKGLLDCIQEQILGLPEDLFFTYIVNFSENETRFLEFFQKYDQKTNMILLHKPGQGYVQNFNMISAMAKIGGYDFYLPLNDDIVLHHDFLKNILKIKEMRYVGFMGGVSQKAGWLETQVNIPNPIDKREQITNLSFLKWEFSACCLSVDVIKKVGDMDFLFSPQIGLWSDNDFLIRIHKLGYRILRDYNCTFWHGKAHSQIEYRSPIAIMNGTDPHLKRAAFLAKLKWNIDISQPSINRFIYDKPYNGKKVIIYSNNLIEIDEKKIKLPEV